MLKDTATRLRERGINPSMQRIAILDYMATHFTHPTVDNIYNDLFPTMPTLSKTTIYNTLTLFAEQGLIMRFMTNDDVMHFDGNAENHTHFKCQQCGKIYDFPLPEIKTPQMEQFEVTDIKLFYYGIYKDCSSGKKGKSSSEILRSTII